MDLRMDRRVHRKTTRWSRRHPDQTGGSRACQPGYRHPPPGIRRAIVLLLLALLAGLPGGAAASGELYIRTSQLGFLPGEFKGATLLSRRSLNGERFELIRSGATVYSGQIGRAAGTYGNFPYVHRITFTPVKEAGVYTVKVRGLESYPFTIGEGVSEGLVDSLLLFFRVQRCGTQDALLHGVCHTRDATSLVHGTAADKRNIDAVGGWHDAGDYVKFLNTTAFAAYTLLFAYEFDPGAFGQDGDGNGSPDVLEEARIGVEWLLKLPLQGNELISQVQDLRDHDQGWRLPENDVLARDRPAFAGKGKNLVGIFAATMACAYRVWEPRDPAFAGRCLTAAENMYSVRKEVPDLDQSGSGMYRDQHYKGKLALGAVELYLSTNREQYLAQAKELASQAGADFWWSWGDLNSYAHYRLAGIDKKYLVFLRKNLATASDHSRQQMFGESAPGRWGSANAMLGTVLQTILLKRLTGEATFDTLASRQYSYIFGENPWGVSFMANTGKNPARHFHSQIAFLRGGYLPGALAAGPVDAATLRQYTIPFEGGDPYEEFQTETSVYRDDRMDYVTNEPTITAAATALFVMGNRAHSSQGRMANEHPGAGEHASP